MEVPLAWVKLTLKPTSTWPKCMPLSPTSSSEDGLAVVTDSGDPSCLMMGSAAGLQAREELNLQDTEFSVGNHSHL